MMSVGSLKTQGAASLAYAPLLHLASSKMNEDKKSALKMGHSYSAFIDSIDYLHIAIIHLRMLYYNHVRQQVLPQLH